MLTTSVEAICFNYRPKKDNTYPIMLRLTKSGKRKYASLGVSVKEEHWDFKKNTPKRNCPDRDFILSIIEKRIAEYRARKRLQLLQSEPFYTKSIIIPIFAPMTIDSNTALVLEGGGLRGVFTCGVLDCFMDNEVRFPFTVGVSAGACNGLSYMSGQRGRAKTSNIDLMEKYHYVGLRYLFTQKCIMDFKLLFEDFPEKIIPYDYDAYFSNTDRFVIVTTNCLTGKAEYLEEKNSQSRVMDIVRASSSLPFVSPITYVDGVPMLDGGIADSIPVEYAMSQGYEKLVVVLTRNKGYRKSESRMPLAKIAYRKYPGLQDALRSRNAVYNRTMDLIERLEDDERIIVIRPVKQVEVGRMEKDTAKLTSLYQEGYDIANAFIKSHAISI